MIACSTLDARIAFININEVDKQAVCGTSNTISGIQEKRLIKQQFLTAVFLLLL